MTNHQNDWIKALADSTYSKDLFYTHGIIPSLLTSDPTLFYLAEGKEGSEQVARSLPLVSPSEDALSILQSDSLPSSFGHGEQRVLDESYRLAKELTFGRIGFNFDPLVQSNGILASIAAFCKCGIESRLYKINLYAKDGHFKRHQDTPKSKTHVGTLLIGPPIDFAGGELMLYHENEKVTIDWSTTGRHGSNDFQWLFFYSDVEHEILPVLSGHRMTIAYDIYRANDVIYETPSTFTGLNVKETPLYKTMIKGLGDASLFPEGVQLAFGLSHTYPAEKMESNKRQMNAILKGSDHLLWYVLKSIGLSFQVSAVYKPEEDRYGEEEDVPAILVSDSFGGIPEWCCGGDDDSEVSLLIAEVGATAADDLVWVREPQNFTIASTYAHYGNEPSTTNSYVAGALIVTLPAAHEGIRSSNAAV